jgi:iron(II)-dependent oxidoreductase
MPQRFAWGTQVWEWTASPFLPYPGFSPDPYAEYAAPFFHTHRGVRGGSFATRPRMRNARYRNYYEPRRDDIFIGFRSCPLR